MTRNLLLTVHISAVAAWLGADFLQYVATARLRRAGPSVDLAWTRITEFLHARYYGVVVLILLASGVGLVFEGDWSWSSRFIWVGIGAVVLGGVLGGGALQSLARRRVAALEANDDALASRLAGQMRPIEAVLSLVVVAAILAMVSKWGA